MKLHPVDCLSVIVVSCAFGYLIVPAVAQDLVSIGGIVACVTHALFYFISCFKKKECL